MACLIGRFDYNSLIGHGHQSIKWGLSFLSVPMLSGGVTCTITLIVNLILIKCHGQSIKCCVPCDNYI